MSDETRTEEVERDEITSDDKIKVRMLATQDLDDERGARILGKDHVFLLQKGEETRLPAGSYEIVENDEDLPGEPVQTDETQGSTGEVGTVKATGKAAKS